MSLPQELDDCIKETIDHTLGLPVSPQTLERKLVASEATRHRLESQCLSLQSKLNQQILSTKSAKEEAKLSAQGLKTAIEKNEELNEENSSLVDQCKKLKEFISRGEMALIRAEEAETRVRELENEVEELKEDLSFFKDQHRMRKLQFSSMEEVLVERVLRDITGETESSIGEFLLANVKHESCRRLLHLSQSLTPSTLRALSLAAKINSLQKDKKQLCLLLSTAQGEAKLLSDQMSSLLEDLTASYGEDEQSHQAFARKPPASSSSVEPHKNKRPMESSNFEILEDRSWLRSKNRPSVIFLVYIIISWLTCKTIASTFMFKPFYLRF